MMRYTKSSRILDFEPIKSNGELLVNYGDIMVNYGDLMVNYWWTMVHFPNVL